MNFHLSATFPVSSKATLAYTAAQLLLPGASLCSYLPATACAFFGLWVLSSPISLLVEILQDSFPGLLLPEVPSSSHDGVSLLLELSSSVSDPSWPYLALLIAQPGCTCGDAHLVLDSSPARTGSEPTLGPWQTFTQGPISASWLYSSGFVGISPRVDVSGS